MDRESLFLGITQVGLLVATALLCAWFTINTASMAAAVQSELDRKTPPGAVLVGAIELSPQLDDLHIYDVVIAGRDGSPILIARHVHAQVELENLSLKKGDVSLVVPQIIVDGFELTLQWDDFGRLNIVDIFKTRSFSLSLDRKAPAKLIIDLNNIILKNGKLRLVWPDFGFDFDDLECEGVFFFSKGKLGIEVARLTATNGLAWARTGSRQLRKRLDHLMPRNLLSRPGGERMEIPFGDLKIGEFTWRGDAFATKVELKPSSGGTLLASGSMAFKKDGIHHQLKANIGSLSPIIERLSNGRISGLSAGQFQVKGVNLAALATMPKLAIKSLKLGKWVFQDFALDDFSYDGLNQRIRSAVSLGMAELRFKSFEAEQIRLKARAQVGWAGFDANQFWEQVFASPVATALQALTGDSGIELERLKTGRFKSPWFEVPTLLVEGLAVSAKSLDLSGRLEALALGGDGAAKATLSSSVKLSLSGVSGHLKVDATVSGLVQRLLGTWLGNHKLLLDYEQKKDTQVTLMAPISAPHRWRVEPISQGGAK